MANVFFAEALRLAGMGFAIFPCRPGEKRPATKHGLHEASRDPDQIRSWWQRWPNANIGLRCDGLLVVDIDPQGLEWPGEARAREIKARKPPLQRTPRNGCHLFFRLPVGAPWRCSTGRLAPGVDTRGPGGYVLVSPSVVGGRHYQWLRPLRPVDELPLPPEWLCRELDRISRPAPARLADPADNLDVLRQGERNTGLTKLAGKLRRLGASTSEIEAALIAFNESRCCPPLPEAEVRRVAKSIGRYPCGSTTSPYDVLETIHPFLRSAWKHAIAHRRRRTRHG
jgi:hypothetical protein